MKPSVAAMTSISTVCLGLCAGCAVPQFDVPQDTAGQPTVATIVERIKCEMKDMVRDDQSPDYVPAFHRLFLLTGDYDVEISLSLDVNDTGGLIPTLNYMNPLSKVSSFAFGGTATLSEAREHNFSENIQLTFRNIYTTWKHDKNLYNCPNAETPLAGKLGLASYVALADLTPELDTSQTLSGKGVFGGYMQFIITKSLTAFGPTWALVNFKNTGGATLSEVNTDKLLYSFAQGPHAGTKLDSSVVMPPNPPNKKAHDYLQQINSNSLNAAVISLQTILP